MGVDMSWQARAMCQGLDPYELEALFFPHPNDNAAAAKAICNVCPVAAECLTYALETRQEFGVWGKTTEQERRPLFKRPAGGLPDARCGTESGYRRHLRKKERTCAACLGAARAARARREGAA